MRLLPFIALFFAALFSPLSAAVEVLPSSVELTAETLATFNRLNTLRQHYVLFGQQDTLAYGIGWENTSSDPWNSDVYRTAGDFPAVFGWDIGHIGEPKNIDGVPFADIRNWIIQVNQRGGINTVSWHHKNPVTGGSSWIERNDHSAYIRDILPGGPHNPQFAAELALVGDFLQSLTMADGTPVPIIFRPYHEFEGEWFWWTSANNSPEAFIALWRYTVDYLRNERGLHNLLFCYNPNFVDMDVARDYYPGDAYVDLIGVDIYWHNHFSYTLKSKARLARLISFARDKGKIPCYSETGHNYFENGQDDGWWSQILLPLLQNKGLAYVLVWRNAEDMHSFVPSPDIPAAQDFKTFTESDTILLLKDLQEKP